jgi:DNA helicase-2/ATP-dependent DNA helicase PcrA
MERVQTSNRVYTAEQTAFIEHDIKSSIILKATAGSGKSQCTMERIKFLLANGVPHEKIIFFSYTTAAVEEIRARLKNDAVKITTIHAFCQGMLAKMKKFKKVVEIYEFISWYKEKNKPKSSASSEVKIKFYELVNDLYENAQYISAEINAYKLQTAEGIRCKKPNFFEEYNKFKKETKTRDFSDMLIEIRDLLKENKWLVMFRNKYDYILIDEFQDTSSIQMDILLKLNAKYYTLIGDIGQSIFGYSGANAFTVMDMLKKRRQVEEMTLSINFRSSKSIVENSNNYSTLKAIPSKEEEGLVNRKIMKFENFLKIVDDFEELVLLCRTNNVIKDIEKEFLLRQYPMNYKNYLSEAEIEGIKKGNISVSTQNKITAVIPVFRNVENLIQFIESNRQSKKFLLTIHKSKGLEFENCVVVNCFSPDILEFNNVKELSEEQIKKYSFDPEDEEDFESKNVFYVAITRPKKSLYFMAYKI